MGTLGAAGGVGELAFGLGIEGGLAKADLSKKIDLINIIQNVFKFHSLIGCDPTGFNFGIPPASKPPS